MTDVTELHKKWMEKPEYRAAYEALNPEFVLVMVDAKKIEPRDVTP